MSLTQNELLDTYNRDSFLAERAYQNSECYEEFCEKLRRYAYSPDEIQEMYGELQSQHE